MPTFIDCEQGTQAWHDARAGHATASRFADIMEGKGRRDAYLYELVAERIAGPLRDSGGMAKEWGHGSEPLARNAYQVRRGVLVREVGFALHDRIKWCGASTDGLVVGERGGIEVKSPFNSGIHARTLALGMPDAHYWQTQGNCWVLDLDWMDFISFDPAFPAPHDLYIQSVSRSAQSIKHLEKEVKAFLAEVNVATRDLLASQK